MGFFMDPGSDKIRGEYPSNLIFISMGTFVSVSLGVLAYGLWEPKKWAILMSIILFLCWIFFNFLILSISLASFQKNIGHNLLYILIAMIIPGLVNFYFYKIHLE